MQDTVARPQVRSDLGCRANPWARCYSPVQYRRQDDQNPACLPARSEPADPLGLQYAAASSGIDADPGGAHRPGASPHGLPGRSGRRLRSRGGAAARSGIRGGGGERGGGLPGDPGSVGRLSRRLAEVPGSRVLWHARGAARSHSARHTHARRADPCRWLPYPDRRWADAGELRAGRRWWLSYTHRRWADARQLRRPLIGQRLPHPDRRRAYARQLRRPSIGQRLPHTDWRRPHARQLRRPSIGQRLPHPDRRRAYTRQLRRPPIGRRLPHTDWRWPHARQLRRSTFGQRLPHSDWRWAHARQLRIRRRTSAIGWVSDPCWRRTNPG